LHASVAIKAAAMTDKLLIASTVVALAVASTAIAAEWCESITSAPQYSCQSQQTREELFVVPRPVQSLGRSVERSGPLPPPVVVLSECL